MIRMLYLLLLQVFNMKRLLIIISIMTVFLAIPSYALAQTLRIGINPPLVEAAVKPGKSIVIAYTITNLGDPMILSADVRPFTPQGIYGDLVLKEELEGPARFNLENSNIRLGQEFFLQSREGQQLILKIRIPEGTPEGDYYYTFFVQNDLGKPVEGEPSTQAQARVGSNILLTVTESGAVDIGGSIGEFSVIPRWIVPILGKRIHLFESTDVIPVRLIMQNTGRNLVKPQGTIVLRGNFGEEAEFNIIPQNILAQSSRMIQASPSATLTKHIQTPASLRLSGFFVGKYSLTAAVDFGISEEKQTETIIFYALPFKLLAAFAVALILGIIVVKRIRQE